ncbi:stalk domain-containing protein [Cytobacillus depressus]|uniref:stalk domain-containing protein n=1 Tax=Cytobacillus depressus TaxID=1602942 RepID=UPI0031B60283
MKVKSIIIAVIASFSLFISSQSALAHPGRLDAKGGHNCSEQSKAAGLCTGYHYHNGTETSPTPFPVAPAPKNSAVAVYINGTKQSYDQPPVIENGRTLVPMRGIFESLGATVDWDPQSKIVKAGHTGTTIVLKIGSKTPTVNGKVVPIDVPAKITNGRTLVPLRFVGEALGASVNYDSATKTITIASKVTAAYHQLDGVVTKVVDGDTVKVSLNGKEETIRLLLIDTPETVHPTKPVEPFGKEASDFAKQLMPPGKAVKVELDVSERDKYGRLLAYVYADGRMVNELLLEKGLARVAYVYVPNTRYVDQFREIQTKAQKQQIGIWSLENY